MEKQNNTDFQTEVDLKDQDSLQNENPNYQIADDFENRQNLSSSDATQELSPDEGGKIITEETQINTQVEGDSPETESESENKNCTLNKKRDERVKNSYYGCIPFILTAIVISLFNMGRVRQPLSFLFLALGLFELAICNFVRSKMIADSCTCKNCLRQSKSAFKYSLIYLIAGLGLLGVFIYFMVI